MSVPTLPIPFHQREMTKAVTAFLNDMHDKGHLPKPQVEAAANGTRIGLYPLGSNGYEMEMFITDKEVKVSNHIAAMDMATGKPTLAHEPDRYNFADYRDIGTKLGATILERSQSNLTPNNNVSMDVMQAYGTFMQSSMKALEGPNMKAMLSAAGQFAQAAESSLAVSQKRHEREQATNEFVEKMADLYKPFTDMIIPGEQDRHNKNEKVTVYLPRSGRGIHYQTNGIRIDMYAFDEFYNYKGIRGDETHQAYLKSLGPGHFTIPSGSHLNSSAHFMLPYDAKALGTFLTGVISGSKHKSPEDIIKLANAAEHIMQSVAPHLPEPNTPEVVEAPPPQGFFARLKQSVMG